MTDPIAAVVAYLRGHPDVTADFAGRAYGGDLPDDQNQHMPRRAVVVHDAGGLGVFGGGYLPYADLRVDLLCYGATPRDAYLGHRTVQAAMKNLRREVAAGMLLHWASQAGGLGQDRDPDTGWPVYVTTWQVLADDRDVS